MTGAEIVFDDIVVGDRVRTTHAYQDDDAIVTTQGTVARIETLEHIGRMRVRPFNAALSTGGTILADDFSRSNHGLLITVERLSLDPKDQDVVVPASAVGALLDAARKWSAELDDYVIPSAGETSDEDARAYYAELARLDHAIDVVASSLPSAMDEKD